MAEYLLDTNHLSPLITLNHPVRSTLIERMRRGDRFGVATPALAELLVGIQALPRAEANLHEWRKLADVFDYYSISREDAELAATLQLELRRQGRRLHTVDALIAAVALHYDLTLLTTDQDFQTIAGISHANWLR